MRPLGVELAFLLKERGIDTVFGIPGVHNIEIYRGVEQAGIRHVLARHEQGAGFMADGYARASGKPGVCFVISGPGLTNILTPVGQAYSDSVPMLVLSTCLDETAAQQGQLHQMKDQEGAGRTIADWSETARTPQAAYALIHRAFQEFHAARPRPKHIQVPIRVLGAGAEPPAPGEARLSDGQPSIPSDLFGVVPQVLSTSRRPLLILGGGARDATGEIRNFLSRCPIPVFTTSAGRGIVPPDYPMLLGSTLPRPGSQEFVESADLVIAVGTELAQVDLWRDRLGSPDRLIHVDIDNQSLRNSAGTFKRLLSTSQNFFRQMAASEDLPEGFDWTTAEIAAQKARWKADIAAERPGIVPVCDALCAALPENTMIFSDMTQFAYAALEVWDLAQPGLWHHPSGFGTLGYALPAAIGGALGHDGPVLAIAGDYGIQYTIQELGAAAELGLSLPILVWDNNALGEIRDNMVSAQISPVAVTLKNPEWRHLAAAYDCGYAEPASIADLCEAINAAFTAGRPTIIRATPDLAA